MAQQIACDLCGEEDAVMLQTNVETGEVLSVGPACVFPYALGIASATAAEFSPDIAAIYRPEVSKLYGALADMAGPDLPEPAAKRRKPKAASGTPLDEPAEPKPHASPEAQLSEGLTQAAETP